ncbi:hypothetical protein AB0O22_31940 [Streptomyces sp. NPDC091204]|uniref:hypothetical protein n=1 Tax=Streptomyces sp. NPDC091204 TaxID=3155299 RepID=UPI0034357059
MSDLDEDATAQEWITQAVDVLNRDTLWTRHLQAEHMSPDEMRAAASFGQTLRDAWLRLTDAKTLDGIEQYASRHIARVAELPARPPYMPDPDAITVKVHGAVDSLRELHSPEASALQQKVEALRAAAWGEGDQWGPHRALQQVDASTAAESELRDRRLRETRQGI